MHANHVTRTERRAWQTNWYRTVERWQKDLKEKK